MSLIEYSLLICFRIKPYGPQTVVALISSSCPSRTWFINTDRIGLHLPLCPSKGWVGICSQSNRTVSRPAIEPSGTVDIAKTLQGDGIVFTVKNLPCCPRKLCIRAGSQSDCAIGCSTIQPPWTICDSEAFQADDTVTSSDDQPLRTTKFLNPHLRRQSNCAVCCPAIEPSGAIDISQTLERDVP